MTKSLWAIRIQGLSKVENMYVKYLLKRMLSALIRETTDRHRVYNICAKPISSLSCLTYPGETSTGAVYLSVKKFGNGALSYDPKMEEY